jgi:glutamyl-Q tRNA(Asp) synthetase
MMYATVRAAFHRPIDSPMQPVFRFAPSPNGRLHLGHAYSALLNADFARRWGGRFLLRVEDIDRTRCRPEFEAAIFEDLAWLGLSWETPVRRQSEHFADYRAAFESLRAWGLVYPCFCTRTDIARAVAAREAASGVRWPRDPDGAPLYPGTCAMLPGTEAERRIRAGDPHAWRLEGAKALAAVSPDALAYARFDCFGVESRVAAHPERWGDAVIVRKDVPASYHLAVVVDDALQGVTRVVRGADLEAATDLHVLLQRLLGMLPPCYHHHRIIRDVGGAKLSKRWRAESLADFRARGATPCAVRRALGFDLGASA